MAHYDLEEQEQIDSLKTWWKMYGSLVTGLVTAAALGMAAAAVVRRRDAGEVLRRWGVRRRGCCCRWRAPGGAGLQVSWQNS